MRIANLRASVRSRPVPAIACLRTDPLNAGTRTRLECDVTELQETVMPAIMRF